MLTISLNFRRIGVVLGLAATLTIAAASMAVAPAAAATKHAVTRPYYTNWVYRSTKINRCVFIEVEGSIVANWEYLYGDSSTNTDHDSLRWTGIKLKNPSISATGWPISGAGCDSTKRWSMKADLEQGWYQTGCDLSVKVAVGFPWSISAAPNYSCGSDRVGHRSSTEGPSTSTLTQYNSGYPISFANVSASTRAGGVGFAGTVTVRAHTTSVSDSVHHTLNVTLNR
jgi:hypothetical protein